jgi:hypothetical protein
VTKAGFHGSAEGNEVPDLLDLRVRYRDTTVSPVGRNVSGTYEGVLIGQAVDHDISAGFHAKCLCVLPIRLIGIGNV